MALRRKVRAATGIAAALALAACGAAPGDSTAALEASLANDSADSLLRDTLTAPLSVDPDLMGQANINAVRSGDRVPGNAIPAVMKFADNTPLPPFPGGKRIAAPEPAPTSACPDCGPDGPATLGALAREHVERAPSVCRGTRIDYGMQWAEQLAAPFALFPGAALIDAAGIDAPDCAVRAVSIMIAAPVRDTTDFYYTLARHAGFVARHQRMDGHAILTGARSRDGTSFMLLIDAASGDRSRVDMVVTQPR